MIVEFRKTEEVTLSLHAVSNASELKNQIWKYTMYPSELVLLVMLENLTMSMSTYTPVEGQELMILQQLWKENWSISNESAVLHKYADGTYLSVAGGNLSNHSFWFTDGDVLNLDCAFLHWTCPQRCTVTQAAATVAEAPAS